MVEAAAAVRPRRRVAAQSACAKVLAEIASSVSAFLTLDEGEYREGHGWETGPFAPALQARSSGESGSISALVSPGCADKHR